MVGQWSRPVALLTVDDHRPGGGRSTRRFGEMPAGVIFIASHSREAQIGVTVVAMARRKASELSTWGASLTVLGVVGVTVVALMAVASNVQSAGEERLGTAGMGLTYVDEFDGAAGAAPNAKHWDYDIGGNGWGNSEQQMYTRDAANVRLSGTGDLVIEARREGDSYTSARLVSRGKIQFGYGLVEVRAKLPEGKGLHPAIWMLGEDMETVGWPQSGEIDIVELVNAGSTYYNAIHGPTHADPETGWKQSSDGPASSNLAADFNVYQLYREPGLIKIGINGVVVGQYTRTGVPADANWVFDAPMYLTLNIAVGGEWPGPVAADTPFPAAMLVDWIRYWQ
jgi:beta-glucanase (GH16 family)